MLLEKIFDILNEYNLDYCVQNKYEIMPEKIPSDIDMMYRNCSEKQLDRIINEISNRTGLIITQKIIQDYYEYTYILSYPIPKERFQLQLDFYKVISHGKFHNILFDKDLLDNKIKYKNFYIPNSIDEIKYIIVRRILKKDFNKESLEKIKKLINCNKDKSLEMICEFFGEDVKNIIEEIILKNDIQLFYNNYNILMKSIEIHHKNNFKLINKIKYICFKIKNYPLKRIIKPCGLCVAFIAPDGSGKSTIINNINKTCSGSFYGNCNYYFRPNIIRNPGYYNFLNSHEEQKVNNNPHEVKLDSKLKSFIRFFYYNFDFIIGMNTKILLQKLQKKLVIFDRYYYDYYLDLVRYKYSFNKIWIKIFDLFIPKPNIIILLDANEDVIIQRKQELTLEEIIEQKEELDKLAYRKNFCKIDANKSIEEVTNSVTKLILEKQSQRVKKKMF